MFLLKNSCSNTFTNVITLTTVSHIRCLKCQFTPSPSAFSSSYKYSLLQPYVRGNDGYTRCTCTYTPMLLLGLTSASTWLVYMHVTELRVCKCTIWYSKRFFVINTTLVCITEMIIWLCENACIYALGVQRVNLRPASPKLDKLPPKFSNDLPLMIQPLKCHQYTTFVSAKMCHAIVSLSLWQKSLGINKN